MNERYTICYAPKQGSMLAAFGARWLGRDIASGAGCMQTCIHGLSEDFMETVTEDPRTMGFVATLKPPFTLADGRTPEGLMRSVADFAASRAPISAPPLAAMLHGERLVMTPLEMTAELETLAAECVTLFDGFRGEDLPGAEPMYDTMDLTPRQRVLAGRFGHPYVLEEFLFSFDLTGDIAHKPCAERLLHAADALTLSIRRQPLEVNDICVFHQAEPGDRFTIVKRFPLSGRDTDAWTGAKAV